MRKAPEIAPNESDRKTLLSWSRSRTVSVRLRERARIVLLAADGLTNLEIAAELGIDRVLVGRWRTRFAEKGISGIETDRPRGGRKPTARGKIESAILEATVNTRPKDATHWSTRTLAAHLGTTQSMVHRVWKANGLKPHLVRTFKISNDPKFEEKLLDVVGLYLNPPENAIVFSADEKSQCQALDRTQPSLKMYPGRCGTLTHDYKRNGTTTLFAAISQLTGQVISMCEPRHRHAEWIKFLNKIDREVPKDLDVHLIIDNYSTHKHEKVKRWLKRHKRFHFHFIPTSSSWLNVIERFFRDLTDKRLRRGSFKSVAELIEAIESYIGSHNENPRPFVWTAAADEILAKVGRARVALDKIETE